jgi:hypothetical protein
MRIGSSVIASNGPEFIKQLLCDACRTAQADYGFVATDHDYRAKHFLSVQEGVSEVQQYIGDNPEHGIPGLYWMKLLRAGVRRLFRREEAGCSYRPYRYSLFRRRSRLPPVRQAA